MSSVSNSAESPPLTPLPSILHTAGMIVENRIIVIGAGASGLMAAGRAAEMGADVLLLEKMERPGLKILVSGNGRCNLSNSRDMDSFIERFGPEGRFLYSPFSRFFRDDLLAFLKRFGIECKTEPNGKIYPVTDNARDIVRVFQRYLTDGGVTVKYGQKVTGITTENGRVTGVKTETGDVPAAAVILAAGGSSHPETGSAGEGCALAETLGHTIVGLRPGLVPLVVTDTDRAKLMQGASLKDVRVTAFQCPSCDIDTSLVPPLDTGRGLAGKKPKPPVIESRTGNVIITHFGFSGPAILEMSRAIVDALCRGTVSLTIDLHPDKDAVALRADLQQSFDTRSRRTFKNILRDYLQPRFIDAFIRLTGISPDKLGNQITAEERERLVSLMKSFRFDVSSPFSMATAMVTAGGISLKEIDPRTMSSKLVPGLFCCGEVLDLDAGTGGYNLQAAFSTGYVAGESAVSFIAGR